MFTSRAHVGQVYWLAIMDIWVPEAQGSSPVTQPFE